MPHQRRSESWDPRDLYDRGSRRRDDHGYGQDFGYRGSAEGRSSLDSWMTFGRRARRSLGRFAIVAAVIVIPLIIVLVVGAILLLVWLLGNAGPLTGTLNGISQLVQQIGKILGTFGGGGG